MRFGALSVESRQKIFSRNRLETAHRHAAAASPNSWLPRDSNQAGASEECNIDTRPECIAGRHMQSTEHVLDRPPPLGNCSAHATASSCTVPSPATSCSRLWPEGQHGRRGRPARTTRTAWQRAAPPAWSAKICKSKQAAAELCRHARHAHLAMHSAKQHRKPGMQYRASIALGTGRLRHVKCSRLAGSETFALDLRTQVRERESCLFVRHCETPTVRHQA